MLAIKTILHPTDFSEHSGEAFELACALARDYGIRTVSSNVEAVEGADGAEDHPQAASQFVLLVLDIADSASQSDRIDLTDQILHSIKPLVHSKCRSLGVDELTARVPREQRDHHCGCGGVDHSLASVSLHAMTRFTAITSSRSFRSATV